MAITNRRIVDSSGLDDYFTPAWAVHAIAQNERFSGAIWECACGDGSMSAVLEQYNKNVISSDLHHHGYGKGGIDFLTSKKRVANIVTNPPFNLAEDFVHKGLELANKKVALLLRLAFLESKTRAETIFKDTPPTRVWVFSERITFYKKGAKRAGSGTTAYAWFVWDKSNIKSTELKWLKPGYKSEYLNR